MKWTGILVHEVFRMAPEDWPDVLPVVEHLIYTTPVGETGLAPRDLDRAWSCGTPLGRELVPYETAPEEPLSEVAKKEFSRYRELTSKFVAIREKGLQRKSEEVESASDR